MTAAVPATRLEFRSPTAIVASDRGQKVSVGRHPIVGGVPNKDAWRDHFPVGFYAGMDTLNSVDEVKDLVLNPTTGLLATGMPYVSFNNVQPYSHEILLDLLTEIENVGQSRIWTMVQPVGRTDAVDNNTGIHSTEWDLANGSVYSAGYHTTALADTIADRIIDEYDGHPSLIAWNMGDDVTESNHGQQSVIMAQAFERRDSYGRPATAVYTDKATIARQTDAKIVFTYRYPCGETAAGDDLPEGDFHRATFSSATDAGFGAGGGDWCDIVADQTSTIPSGARLWMALQAHMTTTGGLGSRLNYPTEAEMRLQFWLAILMGVKGIFWFTWQDEAQWSGLSNSTQRNLLSAATALSSRLTPGIRARILNAPRVAHKFTASGGGSSGYVVNYTNATISTLQCSQTGAYYCVCVNRRGSTQNVTISSATLSAGRLIDLETGTIYAVGSAISFPAFDGKIFAYDPYIGVPRESPDMGVDVETWWSTNIWNPSSPRYISRRATNKYTTVVDVGGVESLTAAIAAYGNETSYRLAAGYVQPAGETVEITGEGHYHFYANDPGGTLPKVRRFYIWGSPYSRQYNGNTGSPDYGIISYLTNTSLNNHDEALQDFYYEPARDFIFQDLWFYGEGDERSWLWYKTHLIDGTYQLDHWAENVPIWMRTVRDVLIEGCTFENWGNSIDVPQGTDPSSVTQTYGVGTWHTGFIGGNCGIEHVVARYNTFKAINDATGYPWAFFLDGSRGSVVAHNTTSGRFSQGSVLFLTNGDFTGDHRKRGRIDRLEDERSAKYNIVYDNDLSIYGIPVAITGAANLIKNNRWPKSGGTHEKFCQIPTRCSAESSSIAMGHYYASFDNVIDGNDCSAGSGTITNFVQYEPDPGYTGLCAGSNIPHKSLVGRSIIKNNIGPGTVTNWSADKAGSSTTSEKAFDVITGNTP